MQPFSFVHAADLHLESPFQGVRAEAPAIADCLRQATLAAYDRLIELCIERRVQFLLVAGDTYDGAYRSLHAQLRFRDGLERLAKESIRSFVVHGNHDPADSWTSAIQWPASTRIFGSREVETDSVRRDGHPIAQVSGISHRERKERRNLARKFSRGDPDVFHIGLLHCNLGTNTGHDPYAPCELSDLCSVGLDYWALGHVHQRRVPNESPHVVYPGNTQGRSIREQGERGCYVVTVDENRGVRSEFCPLDVVRWVTAEVDISGLTTIDQLDGAISDAVQDVASGARPRPVVCRFALTGRGPLYRDIQQGKALQELLERTREIFGSEEPFVWVEGAELGCRPELDIEKRREGSDFLGQLLSIAAELRESTPEIGEVRRSALSALLDNDRVKKAIGELSDAEIAELIGEAELLCVAQLEEGE